MDSVIYATTRHVVKPLTIYVRPMSMNLSYGGTTLASPGKTTGEGSSWDLEGGSTAPSTPIVTSFPTDKSTSVIDLALAEIARQARPQPHDARMDISRENEGMKVTTE